VVPALTSRDAHEVFELRRLYELPVVRRLAARREVPAAMLTSLRAFDSLEDDAPWRGVVRTDNHADGEPTSDPSRRRAIATS
jgi:DNA-binding GntR family transcriptional regulator